MAGSAQDKYAVKVPGGLAFADFKGYEAWQAISTSGSDKAVAVILGNPAMNAAYKATWRMICQGARWMKTPANWGETKGSSQLWRPLTWLK